MVKEEEEVVEPDEVIPIGRNKSTGRFLPGNKCAQGRPARPCLYKISETYAAREKMDLPEAMWKVVKAMMVKAQKGDVAAAKLVISHLTADVSDAVVTMTVQRREDD